jgi:hypothetical protein
MMNNIVPTKAVNTLIKLAREQKGTLLGTCIGFVIGGVTVYWYMRWNVQQIVSCLSSSSSTGISPQISFTDPGTMIAAQNPTYSHQYLPRYSFGYQHHPSGPNRHVPAC